MTAGNYGLCKICGRLRVISKHHARPSFLPHHPNRRGPIWHLCKQCHTAIHTEFTNEQLYHMTFMQLYNQMQLRGHVPICEDHHQ